MEEIKVESYLIVVHDIDEASFGEEFGRLEDKEKNRCPIKVSVEYGCDLDPRKYDLSPDEDSDGYIAA